MDDGQSISVDGTKIISRWARKAKWAADDRDDPVGAHICKDESMPPQEHQRRPEQAHDVLAAEEFGMPAPDPALHRDEAHDVLAAEEFGMPAADPILHHHEPVTLPSDPTGIVEAHDVLAAEEFAMPAGRPTVSGLPTAGGSDA
ncbi:MAG: hypothetical protein M3Y09_11755, partial [Actinomycetota bacterium]|nr:hypothetical protein [Actinomycetota bacterium]